MLFGNKQPDKKTEGRTRSALRFIFMPEFGRSTRQLGQTFQMFVQMLAMMFVTNGMLDKTHRFFQPGAQFTISDLFYETRARFNWRDKTKLPQNIFFIAVWGLLALSVLWMATAVFGLILGVHPAHATNATTSTSTGTMFTAPAGDLGVQYINNLFFGTGINGGPAVDFIQNALRDMLAIYSNAMLVFGSFILLYHVINMVVKAAWEGKALQGSAEIWAPLRLVLAIGMLVPLGQNLNAAQHIVIKIGEVGSGLASFAWGIFLNGLNQQFDPANSSVAKDIYQPGDIGDVFRNMILIRVCEKDINEQIGETARGAGGASACIASAAIAPLAVSFPPVGIPALLATGAICAGGISIGNGIALYEGVLKDERKYGESFNKDLCGEISWPAVLIPQSNPANAPPPKNSSAARDALEKAIKTSVGKHIVTLDTEAGKIADKLVDKCGKVKACELSSFVQGANAYTPDQINLDIDNAINAYTTNIEQDVRTSLNAFLSSAYSELNSSVSSDSGWAMAGAYFMKLAGIQGAMRNALDVRPAARLGPMFNRIEKPSRVQDVPLLSGYNDLAGSVGIPVKYAEKQQEHFVRNKPTYALMVDASVDGASTAGGKSTRVFQANGGTDTSTSLWDFVSRHTPFRMDKDFFVNMVASGSNDPFSALFGVGQTLYRFAVGLIPAAVTIGILTKSHELGFTILGLAFYLFAAAVPLAFILPIIPATRFLIGVLSWLGALFEALVGMPLFALAHLNPKGDSLIEGQKQGYHYLFSIMLKPLFIIFGLIAALLLSTIGITILNTVYSIAIGAMWGEYVFILTAIIFAGVYAFQAYGVCNACFKMIDAVPDNIYQWFIGASGYKITDYDDQNLINPVAGALFLKGATDQISGVGKAAIGVRKAKKDKEEAAENKKIAAQKEAQGIARESQRASLLSQIENKLSQIENNIRGGGGGGIAPAGAAPLGGGPAPRGPLGPTPSPAGVAPQGRGGAGGIGARPTVRVTDYPDVRATTSAKVQPALTNVPFSGTKPYVDINAAKDAANAAIAAQQANLEAGRASDAADRAARDEGRAILTKGADGKLKFTGSGKKDDKSEKDKEE